MYVWINIYT
jgi:uncharacterized membrane protein YgcG